MHFHIRETNNIVNVLKIDSKLMQINNNISLLKSVIIEYFLELGQHIVPILTKKNK